MRGENHKKKMLVASDPGLPPSPGGCLAPQLGLLSTQFLCYNLKSSAPSSCTSHSKHLVNARGCCVNRPQTPAQPHVPVACAGPGMAKPRGWVHGSLACPFLPGTLSSLLLVLTALLSSSRHEDTLLVPRSGFLCTPSSADYYWSRKGPENSIHLKMTAPPLLATTALFLDTSLCFATIPRPGRL